MPPLNPFALAERLLDGIRLTPGQLAQLRAINAKYYTALASPERDPGAAGRGPADLQLLVAADIREMLTDDQRDVFDRNLLGVISARSEPDE